MHALQCVTGVKSPEHHLADLVPDHLSPGGELGECLDVIHCYSVVHKLLIAEARAELDSVGAHSIDEVCDGIVGPVQHIHNFDKHQEDHQL